MIIYVVTYYNQIGDKYVESHHTNYQYYANAKNNIQEELQYCKDLDNFEYIEYTNKNSNELYRIIMSYDGYNGNKIYRKATIKKDYVY